MDNDDDVPDTRVFVSGLPPKYTSDQLGAHFAGRYQITDAVVLPGRQIGFVGFRNYTLAKNAVKYFDKTYIRMSKISVSMARPVEMGRSEQGLAASGSQHLKQSSTGVDVPTERGAAATVGSGASTGSTQFMPYVPVSKAATSNKRKREDGDNGPGQPSEALKEFMSVMQPSKNAVWASEDHATGHVVSEKKEKKEKKKRRNEEAAEDKMPDGLHDMKSRKSNKSSTSTHDEISEPSAAIATEATNTDEREERRQLYQEKGREGKLAAQIKVVGVGLEDDAVAEDERRSRKKESKNKRKSLKDHANAKGGVTPLNEDAFGVEKNETDLVQPNDARSDSDWLRAKTSRILDLVDPKENAKRTPSADQMSSDNEDLYESEPFEDAQIERRAPTADAICVTNGRLFVRNLPFTTREEDLRNTFSKYGKLAEVHIVKDFKLSTSKGMAYLQYVDPKHAETALRGLDGRSFQGRLLHILPASDKKSSKLDEFELSKLPLKKQKSMKRKAEATTSTFSWNSLYMNPDAVLSSVADRLGVDKAEILDPTSSDAAVKQAFAETDVIQKTKNHLRETGVNIEAFKSGKRDDQIILLKNFPYGTTSEELRTLLDPFGYIAKFILPPSGTIAIVQYGDNHAASQALRQLAYKNFKGSVLFLEKGPHGLFEARDQSGRSMVTADGSSDGPARAPSQSQPDGASPTVFVRNLNFSTTTARLAEVFQPLTGFLSARVKTKTDPKRPGEILSMGFGFVEFATSSQAQAAIAAMSGYRLEGHELQVRASHKATDAAEERRGDDKTKRREGQQTKIIIKNLPFEASKKDIRALFSAYGQLRTVRVPKKFDNSTRGFAFAEFVTPKEAQNAIEALANTHLLGRRLVLDFAEGESIDPEAEIQAIEKKVGQQTRMLDISKITGSGRKKFNVDAREDVDPV